MHGHSPGFAFLVNAEVDSMGGVVDGGVGVDTKTSPRLAAIEKAQAELRQEYDVREERKRELDFLEKGGNPLDFKFGPAASISVQSTSRTDQLAEQCVLSEAKGSFALAASPHGDSVDSSGRPGGSVGREPNIADNLLLFDGENNTLDGENNATPIGTRGNTAPLEHSSQMDGCHNEKESEDSVIFRLGVKSQAYCRRNRSRSSRDSGHVGSTNLVLHHGNRSFTLPSSRPDPRDAKGSVLEAQAADYAVSSISNSKPGSPNRNSSKTLAFDDQLDMELGGVPSYHACTDMIKDEVPEGETESKNSENLRENDNCPDGTASISVSTGIINAPSVSAENFNNITNVEMVNGFGIPEKDVIDLQSEGIDKKVGSVTEVSMKNVETSGNVSCSINADADGDQFSMLRKAEGSSDGYSKERDSDTNDLSTPDTNGLRENTELKAADIHVIDNGELGSVHQNLSNSAIQVKVEELFDSRTDLQSQGKPLTNIKGMKLNGEVVSTQERKLDNLLDTSTSNSKAGRISSIVVFSGCEPSTSNLSRSSAATSELQNCTLNREKLVKKAHEDAILKEAQIIEANHKRVGELSLYNSHSEKQHKCHWDFVLEEMTWMANDFMQERVWKTTAAAQLSHRIASSGQPMFIKENMCQKQRIVAQTLATAIMKFWHSAEVFRTSSEPSTGMHEECNSDLFKSWKVNGPETEKDQEAGNSGLVVQLPVQSYAVRFLKYNSTSNHPVLAVAPTTPDRISDAGILNMSWEDQLSEESLFYTITPGAMHVYRESMESQWTHCQKRSRSMHQDDCEASVCGSMADVGWENAYDEDEGETGMYYLPGAFEGSNSLKFTHKKRKKSHQKSYAARSYEVVTDFPYEPCLESKLGNQSALLNGKRPSSTLNVGSIPTKRVRTAVRQRFASPFSAGATGCVQLTSKTDVSSGDTNSFQDDQSSLHGGSQSRKNMEVESTVDFEKQSRFDCNEISTKPKKKKKPKHLGFKNSLNSTDFGVLVLSGKGSSYEQRLQVDSVVQHEQRDHLKKRLENQLFESNGNPGLYGQHAAKKPKLVKQPLEASPEAITPIPGSLPSPVASQMSNMSQTNKLIKIIANRDRGRKSKAMKMAAGQSGSGSPWSLFEDQALVVLVHDMGPNWELVSDAINSTLQFKCIFRKPKECKERHKVLMDKSAGDGADSAEDSGSSQPYPSTLPGIPKGSARQLFQRLQGPMEEDTLKDHFEKIILIGQQLHSRRIQNDSQELKQIDPHSSHVHALSQACPNNLTRVLLTPLDLCDASPDVLALGYQGSHTSGLAIPSHQGSIAPVLPSPSANSMLQGSPGVALGSSLPPPSAALNVPTRDAQRYGVPRPASLSVDDQQRMHYGQMFSGRNIPQSSMSVPGALPVGTERGVNMLPGGNSMGMMSGMSRGMPMSRPGVQGLNSPGMLNMASPGVMLSASGVGMQNPVNVHPNAVPGPGNSMLRPRDTLHMLRPGQNSEDHRQMMMQELQLQVSQGNGQVVAPFNGMSAQFSNPTIPPPVQTLPVQQHQKSHQMPQQPHMLTNPHHPPIQGTNHPNPQQQAYAIRFAKERQLQRLLHQPQHPFSGSNAISPVQNSSQIQQQTQPSSPVTPIPSPQSQHKQQSLPQNPQSGGGMPNQMMKQRQRQQAQQQQPRNHQQQRQQSQQQAKLMKGIGRGTMLMHQNVPVDVPHVNGLSMAPKNQVSEKHLTQPGHGFFPSSSCPNPTLSQSSDQQKMYSRQPPQSSKKIPPMPSDSDTCNQGSVQVPPNRTLLASQQPQVPSSLPLGSQQWQTSQSQQTMQRMMLQPNHQMNSDGQMQSSADQVQVNQMIPTAPIPQCTESVTTAPMVSSASHWKPEPSFDTNTPTPTAQLANLTQPNLVGNETIMPPSSQGLAHRQFSGSMPMQGHGIGGQWRQQQEQQQPQQQSPKQQHRQAGQGNLYVRPSNSGSG